MDIYINVQNFGPIEKAGIDLRPLTVFVGESNTGKTYLAALIYALHKHFEGISRFSWAGYIPSYFNFVSRLLPPYSQNWPEEMEQEMLGVFEKLNTPERPFKFSDLPQQARIRSESVLTDRENFTDEIKRCFDLESVSRLIRFTGSRANEMKIFLSVRESDQTCWSFEARDAGSGPTIAGYINPDLILLGMQSA